MCSLYRNQYRSESTRLQGYNYAGAGSYFVTIVTKDRIQYFGSVLNGEMVLTQLGIFLQNQWLNTPGYRPDMNILLDEFVVMPDHFHAIVVIGDNKFNTHGKISNSTLNKDDNNHYSNKFGPQSKNLASVIRGLKSKVTTYARKNNLEFAWQNRFYDRIIRSEKELIRIRKYIIDNPSKWTKMNMYM
jgi:putative transposase